MKTLLYISSQSGFDLRQAPLGGPAFISDSIAEGLQKRTDFQFRLLSSGILGSRAPRYEDFLQYKPKQWIDFLVTFEQAAMSEVLRYDPRDAVILSNDSLRLRK